MPGIAVVKPVVCVLHGDVSGTPSLCKLLTSRRCRFGSAPPSGPVACSIRTVCSPRAFSSGLRRRTTACRCSPVTSSDGSQKGSAYPAPHQTLPAWHFESRLPRICDRACPGTYCWRRQSPVAASSSRPAGPGLAQHSPASCRFDSKAACGGCAPESSRRSTSRVCRSTRIRNRIDSGGVDFDIEQAHGGGGFSPLARLTLRHLDPSSDDIAFDPVLHSDEDVRLVPGWLADLRRAAYRRSREGRDAG